MLVHQRVTKGKKGWQHSFTIKNERNPTCIPNSKGGTASEHGKDHPVKFTKSRDFWAASPENRRELDPRLEPTPEPCEPLHRNEAPRNPHRNILEHPGTSSNLWSPPEAAPRLYLGWDSEAYAVEERDLVNKRRVFDQQRKDSKVMISHTVAVPNRSDWVSISGSGSCSLLPRKKTVTAPWNPETSQAKDPFGTLAAFGVRWDSWMSRCVGFPQFCAKLVGSPQEKLSTINKAIPAIPTYTQLYKHLSFECIRKLAGKCKNHSNLIWGKPFTCWLKTFGCLLLVARSLHAWPGGVQVPFPTSSDSLPLGYCLSRFAP